MFTKYLGFIVVFFIGLIPLFDLFHPGLPLTHDGQDHVARIANFYQSLSEGNIVSRWAGNLNWGYGHPILMFLYPLPSYFTSFFHFLGFSLIDSLKIVFGVTFIASGIAMHLWVRNFLGELPALFASILYSFAPYRFVDLYVRGAIGEHVAFVFVPLVLYFLLKLSQKYSYWNFLGGVLSLAFLILSHNAIAIMFLPFILAYGIYLIFTNKNQRAFIYQYTSILVIGIGLSSFFWFPAFFEGKYTLRDIVTRGEYASRFVKFPELFSTMWSYGGTNELSKNIGIIQFISVIGSLLFVHRIFKKDKKKFLLYGILLLYFFISTFLMLEQSKFVWQVFTTLQKFQFPWRFLSVTVFTTAVMGGILLFEFIENRRMEALRFRPPLARLRSKNALIILCLLFLVLWFNKNYWHANGYLYKSDSFFNGIYQGTTDTGESSPIWSVRFMEQEPKSHIEIIDGKGETQEFARNSIFHKYKISTNDERIRVRENTLYFPGWNVFVDGKDTLVEFQDPKNRGVITFYVNKGIHDVEVKFGETKLRKTADVISVVSFFLLTGYGFMKFKQR